MEDTKVSEAEWEVAVGASLVAKHEAVARAVHGLEGKLLLLYLKVEHVVLVVLPMTRSNPEVLVVPKVEVRPEGSGPIEVLVSSTHVNSRGSMRTC